MKPAPFDYVRADSVEHAVARLAAANDDGEGKIIAGGQSLMPLLALRLAQPSVLIDINRVPGLDAISPRPEGGLRFGFCTPGFLISALHLLTENPDPAREDIRAGLSGNICRCTGYTGIVDAVQQAAAAMRG